MAKTAKKKLVRREYTKDDEKTLRAHSKAQTPLEKIAKEMKRTGGSLRQKAIKLGIPLGHRRRKAKKVVTAKAAKTSKIAKTVKKAKTTKTAAKAKKTKK
jgi:hypothetical protein